MILVGFYCCCCFTYFSFFHSFHFASSFLTIENDCDAVGILLLRLFLGIFPLASYCNRSLGILINLLARNIYAGLIWNGIWLKKTNYTTRKTMLQPFFCWCCCCSFAHHPFKWQYIHWMADEYERCELILKTVDFSLLPCVYDEPQFSEEKLKTFWDQSDKCN